MSHLPTKPTTRSALLLSFLMLAPAAWLCEPTFAQFGNVERVEEESSTAELEERLDRLQETVEELLDAYAEITQEIGANKDHEKLPAMENARLAVFPMKALHPDEAADYLENLIGLQPMRTASNGRGDQLIVFAPDEILIKIHDILKTLDVPKVREKAEPRKAIEARGLLARIFWLADGLSEGTGQPLSNYLPPSVLDAVTRLGLQNPRIVIQNTSSMTMEAVEGASQSAEFRSDGLPVVVINGESLIFSSKGHLSMFPENSRNHGQLLMEFEFEIDGKYGRCKMNGSAIAPLSHYMVLGTTNYVVGGPTPALARGGEGLGGGGFGGGGGGGFGVVDTPPTTSQPSTSRQPSPSRFAFVVQVIEAESFEPEK